MTSSEVICRGEMGYWGKEEALLEEELKGRRSILVSSQGERAKKRVRWPDIEGEKENCYEVRDMLGAESEEEGTDNEEQQDDDDDDGGEEEETAVDVDVAVASSPMGDDASSRDDDGDGEQGDDDDDDEEEDDDDDEEEEEEQEESDEESENQEENQIQETKTEVEESEEEEEEEQEDEDKDVLLKDKDINQLYSEISELQKNLLAKSSGMERLQREMESVSEDSELTRKRLRRLQEELEATKRCNRELIDRINKQSEGEDDLKEKVKEAQKRVDDLERKLLVQKEANARLEASINRLEKEREEETIMVNQALDEAVREQEETESRFNREFEELRTVNANRELKLVEDFEWKLRQVQKDCKKQIQEKEKEADMRSLEDRTKLTTMQAQLEKVEVCEVELKQVRAASQEHKRNLRTLTRKYEELQVSDKILQEETNRLRVALETERSNLSAIQTSHREEVTEKERKFNFRLTVQRNQISTEWEEKLKRDCAKLKSTLESCFRDEKRQAVETVRREKEEEANRNKQTCENKIQQYIKEIGGLKKKLLDKDDEQKRELERARTKSDGDALELRRKMDKLDMSYQEQIEKLQEKHEKELGKIKEEWEKRVEQYENNLQAQAGTTRTTLELVKQQMQKEAETQLQQMREIHQKALERQWREVMADKEGALAQMEDRHRQIVEHLKNELASLTKSSGSKEEIKAVISSKDTLKSMSQELILKNNEMNKTNQQSSLGNAIIVLIFLAITASLFPINFTFFIIIILTVYYRF